MSHDNDRRDFCKTVGVVAVGFGAIIAAPGIATVAEAAQNSFDKSYYKKIHSPDKPAKGDIWATPKQQKMIGSCKDKFGRVMRVVGYGKFNYLDMDSALKIADRKCKTGRYWTNKERTVPFSIDEKVFMKDLFDFKASDYGFFGEKVIVDYGHKVASKHLVSIKGSGHYLLEGESKRTYQRVKKDVGNVGLILTSGIRNVPKQMYLFMAKSQRVKGNLSAASRSLAPPGYSWHGVRDFDVGKPKAGMLNFSPKFVNTLQFKKLKDMGYLKLIRYPQDNQEGVRFEPWHIMVSHGLNLKHANLYNPDYQGLEKLA